MDAETFMFADYGNTSLNSSLPDGNRTSNDTGVYVQQPGINMLIPIVAYCIMFVVAAAGNVTVLVTLLRVQRKSRVNLLLLHLTIADLIVTFFMIPMEVMWRVTNQWRAGNVMCKLFMVIRAFGPYLSSNILVCITLDRYFVILYPLRISGAMRRGKMMLAFAWAYSFVCAFPQSIVFKVLQHPADPNFHQCVTFGAFFTETQEMLYNIFCLAVIYFIPLSIIIFSYSCILYEISNKSRENAEDYKGGKPVDADKGRIRLRKSDTSTIARAKSRTLKMTITIVVAFIWCWTPYVVMTLWYMLDRTSAQNVDKQLQEILFLMAVSNSCVNPLVYGSYALNLKTNCRRFGIPAFYGNHLRRRSTIEKMFLNPRGSRSM
ncbi:UNVERIFIED_CONTAM: hypothetical protein PYX00_007998 [Menopon gallinae]|uniref:G-protein coupled receptors family 1 profile domain-containing protein n=1 Tax=Menopon gallinae TaxID=328185 RepID=A0AAW2HLG2_9NEOP